MNKSENNFDEIASEFEMAENLNRGSLDRPLVQPKMQQRRVTDV